MALQIPPNCDLTLGMTCLDKSEPGRTVWRVRIDERFLNPAGVVQGGFLAAMLDSAMGASAVTALGQQKVVVTNTEMKVSFLRAVSPGEELRVTATILKTGRLISFLEAKMTNSEGALVAAASSTYLVKARSE